MNRPELSENQKDLLKQLKKEWKEKISLIGGIYCDRRKNHLRVKLYFIPRKEQNKAVRIAKKYNLGKVVGRPAFSNSSDCIVEIPYSWF